MSTRGLHKARVGVIIDYETRREHHYLERDWWFLVLFGDELHWQISHDCEVFATAGDNQPDGE